MPKRIVTAWCERSEGPGWTNDLVWLIEDDGTGKLSQRALQPDEQSPWMKWLFPVCKEAHDTFMRAVQRSTEVKEVVVRLPLSDLALSNLLKASK
jgi:hypothetical protein